MSQQPRKYRRSPAEGADASTRGRLLDVAERLFAAQGFRDTSVRQIASQAGANAAAVNYHFGGKENLYEQVMRRNLEVFFDGQLAAIWLVMSDASRAPSVADLARAFTRAWLLPVTSGNEHILQLSFRERADRRLPDDVGGDRAKAVEDAFVAALSQLILISDDSARQCVRCFEVLLSGLLPELMFRSKSGVAIAAYDELVEHVIRFSVAGIYGFTQ